MIRKIATILLSATLLLGAPQFADSASAKPRDPWQQCDEAWQAPNSKYAKQCEKRGWLITKNKSTWRPCSSAIDEADSRFANWCRSRGWTITWDVAFGPKGYLRTSTLGPCPTDESYNIDIGDCVWDSGRQGNRCGRGFWYKNAKIHYARRKVAC